MLWRALSWELHRALNSPRCLLAFGLIAGCSFIGVAQYGSVLPVGGERNAWLSLAHGTYLVTAFLPMFGGLVIGDTFSEDRASGYFLNLATRVGWDIVTSAKALATLICSAGIIIVGMMPALIVSLVMYPAVGGSGLLPGLIAVIFHGSLWELALENLGVMALASMAWVAGGALVVSGFTRRPSLCVVVPTGLYLAAALVAPAAVNPMIHADLFDWTPSGGPMWVDAVVWGALLMMVVGEGWRRWCRGGIGCV